MGERPTWLETVGVLTTLASFVGLSFAGRLEGVHFHRNKWVGFLIAGTLPGAVSSLYDKYLLGRAYFSVPTVQAWFSVYLLVLFTPFAIGWKRRGWSRNEFHWRWSIPFIAFSLLAADYIYFSALRDPISLVAVVMSLRRGSMLVGFAGGLLRFGKKWAAKTSRRDQHSGGHCACDSGLIFSLYRTTACQFISPPRFTIKKARKLSPRAFESSPRLITA